MSRIPSPAALIGALPSAAQAGIWILLAGSTFVLMMALVRDMAPDLPVLTQVFWRSVFGICFMVPWLMKAGLGAVRTRRPGMHFVRSFFNYLTFLCFMTAATMIPLADVTAISFTRPIIASVLAIFILREAAMGRRWLATCIGFAGALIIVRPGIAEFNTGVLLVLIGVAIGAVMAIVVKSLARTEAPDAIALYAVAFMIPASFVGAMFDWKWPTADQWPWLIVIGALGQYSQRALSRAYHAADATVVLSFDFLRLPTAALVGFLIFGEVPEPWIWVGGAVICGSSIFLSHREARAQRRAREAESDAHAA